MSQASTVQVDVHVDPAHLADVMREEVVEGLTSTPKQLQPKWFYDDRGSRLFDEITRLDEYYPTRREREILVEHAPEIVRRSGADTLVELGSGTSEKTRTLLDAFADAGRLRRFVPFDVSEGILRTAAAEIDDAYPGIDVHGVVGDFDHHLGEIPHTGRRLVAFLGGTIGNFPPDKRKAFLRDIGSALDPDDALLLGTDLVKDVDRLEAAYNDRSGLTAAFNKNVLHVLNRELRADFDPDRFEHIARWDPHPEWIEMLLRSQVDQVVHIADLEIEIPFSAGEEMRTEISAKFRRERVERELSDADLHLEAWWTDPQGDFALSLAVPT